MHSKKILHRDIKTLNVFLDDGLNVKLGDMGVAKVGGWEGGRGGISRDRCRSAPICRRGSCVAPASSR